MIRSQVHDKADLMNSVLTIGFLIMLTLLIKSLLMDNDAPSAQPRYVEPFR